MNRRWFIGRAGAAGGFLLLPAWTAAAERLAAGDPIPAARKKRLADAALNAATKRGATYADVRIGRYLRQSISTRETKVDGVTSDESYGAGVRVIADGAWGFMATDRLSEESVARAAAEAVAIAIANARLQDEPVVLAPQAGVGEVAWRTPIRTNPFAVSLQEKVEHLLAANRAALAQGASFINTQLYQINEQKYFASTDGSYIDQDIHRLWPTFTVTATDQKTGRFETRNALSSPVGRGYEYLGADPAGKRAGATVRYFESYDLAEDAVLAAQQAREKLAAKRVVAGQYDLVLDPTHLGLTIHESVGHATELDRVLGYEANYAGTSFATLDKWKSKDFKYGSPIVNFFADRTEAGTLGAVGYDDEGVPAKRWPIIRDGILVDYQKTRDQAHMVGQNAGDGCSYAQSWNAVQFQRMPNVSLQPGAAPLTPAEMIKRVERGIYIVGRGSFSIDQQRYNFQFGGQLFYEIKNGEIAGMLRDVAYQSNTQEFWNSCVAICDRRDYMHFGSFFDGKGQPSQVSAVSHGSATSRFNKVNVLNTGRRI
ncbi:MAG: TldD protein [Opitutia bacterium Tous-C1TDCM]|nr:MAG: TldD protein [Opitutae bacterium Tous-C1TDCM]